MSDKERYVTFKDVPQGDDLFCYPCPLQTGSGDKSWCGFFGNVLNEEDGYAVKCDECLDEFPIEEGIE